MLTEVPSLHRSCAVSQVLRTPPPPHTARPSLTSYRLTPTTITAGASRVASGLLCLHAIAITPAGPTELVRSLISIVSGLPCVTVRSAPAIIVSGPAQRSLTLWPVRSPSRLATLYTKAPAASLPPPPFRLLPRGANQFPGGSCTRCSPAPFTAHCYVNRARFRRVFRRV